MEGTSDDKNAGKRRRRNSGRGKDPAKKARANMKKLIAELQGVRAMLGQAPGAPIKCKCIRCAIPEMTNTRFEHLFGFPSYGMLAGFMGTFLRQHHFRRGLPHAEHGAVPRCADSG